MGSRTNSGSTGVLLAFLAGGIVGALVGLLVAPQRGKKLRADISERATNILQDGEQAVRSAASTVGAVAKDVERKAEKLLSR